MALRTGTSSVAAREAINLAIGHLQRALIAAQKAAGAARTTDFLVTNTAQPRECIEAIDDLESGVRLAIATAREAQELAE